MNANYNKIRSITYRIITHRWSENGTFNYIFAKSNNGIFKIRIEDTDKIRNTESSVDSIINGLNWLGLKTDQKIIYQSKNKDEHVQIAEKMIDENLAYKCFHTDEELAQKRKKNKKFKSEWRGQKKRYH